MARTAQGRFLPGHDPDRHTFTHDECIAGYDALLTKIQLEKSCGIYWAKRWAFRRMCKTESIRYNNPAIEVKPKLRIEYARDIRIKNGHKR